MAAMNRSQTFVVASEALVRPCRAFEGMLVRAMVGKRVAEALYGLYRPHVGFHYFASHCYVPRLGFKENTLELVWVPRYDQRRSTP